MDNLILILPPQTKPIKTVKPIIVFNYGTCSKCHNNGCSSCERCSRCNGNGCNVCGKGRVPK